MSIQQQVFSRPRLSLPSHALVYIPKIALGVDAVLVTLSGLLALVMRQTNFLFPYSADVGGAVPLAAALTGVTWLFLISFHGGYTASVFEVGTDEFRRVTMASLTAAGLVGAGCFFFHFQVSRGAFFLTFLIGTPALIIGRLALRSSVHRARRHGALHHTVLIAGSVANVDEVAATLRRQPQLGYHIVGALTDDADHGIETPAGIPLMGDCGALTQQVITSGADILFLADGSLRSSERMQQLAWDLETHDAQLVVAPSLPGISSERIRLRPVGGLPLMHVDPPRTQRATRWSKRTFDIIVAALLLTLTSPLFLVAAWRVRRHDSGPALFAQVRVGRDGTPFNCLKFRTMVVDAEGLLSRLRAERGGDSRLFKLKEDPRITKPGRWLRRFSIDELPQLVNILRGDMSLVGPRPPLPSEVADYHAAATRRLRVRPGLTGLWQVSGRSDLTFEEAIRLDLYYVDNWSMFQDLSILLKTFSAVLGSRGAY